MILIYRLPNQLDGYVGVMTAPHASVTWVIDTPQARASLHMVAQALGVRQLEIDAVLESADSVHFGAALRPREPAVIETGRLTHPGLSLLLKSGEGYVGLVTGTPWAPRRRVRGALRCDWIFARPISQRDVVDGMLARGHHGQDVWDLVTATDERGWGYV